MSFDRIAISCGALTLSLALLGSACSSVRIAPKGADNENLHTGRLQHVNPLEIAVLRVQNSTGVESLPLEHLRSALASQLVEQRYSPLSLSFVDSKLADTTEASYTPGELQENAVLQTFLTKWDESRWRSHSEVTVAGEIYLLDVASPDVSRSLWGGRFERAVSVADLRAAIPTDTELRERLVERLADEVLASLPARNPENRPSR